IHDAIATGFAVIEASLLITLANWAMPGDYRVFRLAVPLLAAPAALMGIGIFRLLPRLLSRTPATGSRLLIVATSASHPAVKELEVAQARDQVAGKTVLVTGAAGSIGSELCRLLAGLAPARLVLVDNNESGLFDIAEELRMAMSIDIREALISITEREQLLELFAEERPELVFHAAAYKHVPMMEMHPAQAVMTNVIGTYNTLRCAEAAGVKSFVLISTDKAVARHSVMGCTKRLCEQMILGWRGEMTCWAVRFGNVVGSRGSVVPLFERQIELGGPVTITHPEMTRYMMTIREAVSLVIKTLTVAKAGHVYMLDMGEPMKIVSLAEALVRARGLRPGADIEIVYTGLRPGERLHEELLGPDEGSRPTDHPAIMEVVSPKSFNASPDPVEVRIENFPKYVRRQHLTRLLALYEVFKRIIGVKGSIVECGVNRGYGLMAWAKLSAVLEPVNLTRRIYGFDSFAGFPAVSDKDRTGPAWQTAEPGALHADSYAELLELISLYDK